MAATRRELFRPGYDFVAVRPIRLTAKETIQPGTKLDNSKFRGYHLRSLYQRRRIGVAGSPWTLAMLDQLEDAHARPEVVDPKGKTQEDELSELLGDENVSKETPKKPKATKKKKAK